VDRSELVALIDQARARNGLSSDRRLDMLFGFSGSGVNQWRRGKAWPSDEAAVKLAELAGVDPEALVLRIHQAAAAERGEQRAAAFWRALAEKVSKTAAALLIGCLVGWAVTPGPARAAPGTGAEQASGRVLETRHYATRRRRWWRRFRLPRQRLGRLTLK